MKKLIAFLFILVALGSYGQRRTTVDGLIVKDYIILQGDTLDLSVLNDTSDYVQFNPGTETTYGEGRLFYDSTKKVVSFYNDIVDVTMNIGEELWVRVNNTGADIPNGSVVYIDTAYLGLPTIQLAKADIDTTCDRVIGVATHTIGSGEPGLITTFGSVGGLNTSGCSSGEDLYLSASVAGMFTNVRPSYPNYIIKIGSCLITDVLNGSINVNMKGDARDILENGWNGNFLQSFDFRITSSGTVITGSLTRSDASNHLTMNFSTGLYNLDVSPAKAIILTAGTDATPQTNYIYIPLSTKVLTKSTSSWPSEEHIRVATAQLRSATKTLSDGALGNQNWNDHVAGITGSRGHILHISDWVRLNPARYISGAKGTATIVSASSPDDVYISTTSGIVSQMHPQTWTATNMATGDDIHVYNHPTTAWQTITNLNTQLQTSTGASLSGRSFSFVVWGIQNKTGEMSHMILNLPSGSYSSAANAISDFSGYSDYTIPQDYIPKAFLIARFTFSHSVAGGGTWTLEDTEDLTGRFPNTSAGGGSGGSGVSTLLQLTDAPSSYTGAAGAYLQVNSGETAIEFTRPTYGELYDTVSFSKTLTTWTTLDNLFDGLSNGSTVAGSTGTILAGANGVFQVHAEAVVYTAGADDDVTIGVSVAGVISNKSKRTLKVIGRDNTLLSTSFLITLSSVNSLNLKLTSALGGSYDIKAVNFKIKKIN